MHELRWDPVLEEWVILAAHRGKRPLLAKKACPFCPGSEEVAGDWVVKSLPNRFPCLVANPPSPKKDDFYKSARARGVCEVILETKEHDKDLADLPVENIRQLLELQIQRYKELSKKKGIKYVLIFRNKGEVIGVTLHHPHGQIYAFPFVPPKIARELESSAKYAGRTGKCLFCDVIKKERRDKARIVLENEEFICFVPFYAHWPYEVHIFPKRHVLKISELDEKEKASLAAVLKKILTKYNSLFGFSMPYTMVYHNACGQYKHYHFHIEICPPYRSREKLKYPAGTERGAGVWSLDKAPEESARELRRAI